MIFKRTIFILTFLIIGLSAYAQEAESFRHHQIIATIGHVAVPSSEDGSSNEFIAVPTWGLSYEYDFNEIIGLGLKSDIELSNYQIRDNEEDIIVREYPISLVAFVKVIPVAGFGIYAGGGLEFASEENLSVFNFGLSYDIDFLERWVLAPEIGYELKGGHTSVFTVGLSVGIRFGN